MNFGIDIDDADDVLTFEDDSTTQEYVYSTTKQEGVMSFDLYNATYLDTVYLYIELQNGYGGLSVSERYQILNAAISISFSTSGVSISGVSRNTILTQLLHQIILNKQIIETETSVQIPILSFNKKQVRPNKISIHFIGLSSYATDKIKLLLVSKNNIKPFDFYLTTPEFIQNITTCYTFNNDFVFELLKTNYIAKALFLYVKPKNVDSLYTNIDISKITIQLDSECKIFNIEDINSIDLLGVCVYIIPFSDEFTSIENMSKALSNLDKIKDDGSGIVTMIYKNPTLTIECCSDVNDYIVFIDHISLRKNSITYYKVSYKIPIYTEIIR